MQQDLPAFPNTIPWQILVLVVCMDSQGKEDATCYFTVTAMSQRYSLDLSTKNCLAEVLCDLLKYQMVNQRSDIVHLYFMFSPRVVAYRQDSWNARSLFGHRHGFNWVLANSTAELWKIRDRVTNVEGPMELQVSPWVTWWSWCNRSFQPEPMCIFKHTLRNYLP